MRTLRTCSKEEDGVREMNLLMTSQDPKRNIVFA